MLHILYWIFIVVFFFSQFNASASSAHLPPDYLVIQILIRIVVLIFISYSFLFFVIPLYKISRLTVFWLSLIGLIAFWYMIQIVLMKLVVMQYHELNALPTTTVAALFKRHLFGFLAMFVFFMAFYYFMDIYDRQREIKLLAQFKTEKIALESSFLKSQVNPHFLFNTLNNIYSLSLKKSEQTPVIIERLESLLHYMLYECKADRVPLADEFTFTNSYIALEKLRHREEDCVVTVTVSGAMEDHFIAPLLLVNFLENAFKHGTKTSFGKSWINMRVTVDKQRMHFNLQNSKPLQIISGNPAAEYSGGIGLKNVGRRLQILYPDRHSLVINNLKDRFEVDLIVDLT